MLDPRFDCDNCNKKSYKLITWNGAGTVYCTECVPPDRFTVSKPVPGSWTRHNNTERQVHRKDILQPLKKDGTINKDFVTVHGTKTIEKEYKLSRRQIMQEID